MLRAALSQLASSPSRGSASRPAIASRASRRPAHRLFASERQFRSLPQTTRAGSHATSSQPWKKNALTEPASNDLVAMKTQSSRALTHTSTAVATPPPATSGDGEDGDLAAPEVKDAQIIFGTVWKELEQQCAETGQDLTFPREIIWLMGAPGAGKGTQTPFICKNRQISAAPIEMSQLLDTPEQRASKSKAVLVGDKEVFMLLLEKLLSPEYRNGCLIDGFPRTEVQVELLKLFHARMEELHHNELAEVQSKGIGARPGLMKCPRPLFRITVLYVGEKESVKRQLYRGRMARQHNETVVRLLKNQNHDLAADDSRLQPVEVRPTDLSEELARARYITFIEHFSTLKSLVKYFPYHLIDSEGAIEDIETKIDEELRYQSQQELDTDTYELIRKLPLASTIIDSARRDLVHRLDNYADMEPELFSNVVNIIEHDFLPVLVQHALSGKARIKSDLRLWSENESAVSMVIDVLTERGFRAFVSNEEIFKPYTVDSRQRVLCHSIIRWEFQVEWSRPKSLHDPSLVLTH